MTRPRLLFVPNPHVRLDRTWAVPYVPLELLSAMATARASGAEPALFDVNLLVQSDRLRVGPDLWADAADLLAEAGPDLVILETWTGTLHGTLLLTRKARARMPGVPLVLAGAGTSAVAREVLETFDQVDAVIRGEMEPATAWLARSQVLPLPAAPGLVHRTGSGIQDAELAWVRDVESLPRPAYDLALLGPGDTVPVEPGRGCGQGCTFCALAGHWPPIHRPRDPAGLAREMADLARRFAGSALDLTQDPMFFNDGHRLETLCRLLLEQGTKVAWTCHARVDRLIPAQLELLRRAGCRGILFGVETGCPSMQRGTGKNVDLARLEPLVSAAREQGMEARVSFILGLPGEDRASLDRTVRTLLGARRAGASDTPVQLLRAYPGSRVHAGWRTSLVFEPVLCQAAQDDRPALDLIRAHPWLLSASYRVACTRPGQDPGSLPRDRLMAAWVVLTAFPDVLLALGDCGLDPGGMLSLLSLDPVPGTLEQAAVQTADLLEAQVLQGSPASPAVDPRSLRDLVSYQLGQFLVSQQAEVEAPGPDPELLSWLQHRPGAVVPVAAAPWLLLLLHTDLEQLLEGRLAPCPHDEARRVLLVKSSNAGQASFYTRRSFSVETLLLDEVGAELMRLLDRGLDLAALGQTVAARLRLPPAAALASCAEVTGELVTFGVLALGQADTMTRVEVT